MATTETAIQSLDSDDDTYFDASFFIDETYVEKEYIVGPHTIKVLCLQCSSTDFDLTGQLIWPGAGILNDYLVKNHSLLLDGLSIIELGSGVGLNGLLCAQYCRHVVMTDHNTTVLKVMKRNVELQDASLQSRMDCEELDWGNEEHLQHIKDKHPDGFDLILGADICYHQSAVKPLFATVKAIMELRPAGACKFILGYVSRFKSNDLAVNAEVHRLKMHIAELPETRLSLAGGAHEGWVYKITKDIHSIIRSVDKNVIDGAIFASERILASSSFCEASVVLKIVKVYTLVPLEDISRVELFLETNDRLGELRFFRWNMMFAQALEGSLQKALECCDLEAHGRV